MIRRGGDQRGVLWFEGSNCFRKHFQFKNKVLNSIS
jgi:hypothetical protein